MKRILVAVCLLTLTINLCSPACADPTPAPTPGAPAKKVNTIFDYQKDLNLTDEQVTTMKGALKELNESVTAGRSKIATLEANYRKFLESEPSISAAKTKLREIADAQVELRIVDLQTSRKIIGTLKPEQLKKWREIQVKMHAK